MAGLMVRARGTDEKGSKKKKNKKTNRAETCAHSANESTAFGRQHVHNVMRLRG